MPDVVSCLLLYEDKLLILKRSDRVGTYKGRWGVVAGYVEPDEDPYETALKEIQEEAGLAQDDVKLIKKGPPVHCPDIHEGKTYDWMIHPFIFKIEKKGKIQIDWEHTAYKWIPPHEITHYETVPCLQEIVQHSLVNRV